MSENQNSISLLPCLLVSLLPCFFVLFFTGCSAPNDTQFLLFASLPSQKINNIADFSGDRRSELIFWNTSSMSKPTKFLESCFFEVQDLAKNKHTSLKLGDISDIPFVGYFDEDLLLDLGVYNRDTNEWTIKSSTSDNRYTLRFGEMGDLPVPSDYDGDGKYDFVVYTRATSTFKGILSRSNMPFQLTLGIRGDIPVPKDYDGDGKSDFATYRQAGGIWTIKRSTDSSVSETVLGGPYYLPIPGDYDGDSKADLCVFNTINKKVELSFSQSGTKLPEADSERIKKELGGAKYFPVQLDYDADGKCEIAFWDSLRKLLIIFNIKDNLRKNVFHFAGIKNSFPVNNFLLRNFPVSQLSSDPVLSRRSRNEKGISFVADFDGDYVDDSCLWSASTGAFLCTSSRVGWDFGLKVGEKSDKPFIGNFNNDNITDIGSYRSENMTFYYRLLGRKSPHGIQVVSLSENSGGNSVPQIGDYDGDSIDDFAVYNPDEKVFIARKSSDSNDIKYEFCSENDCKTSDLFPIVCDFDGDSKSDAGVIDINRRIFSYFSTYYGNRFNKTLSGEISNDVFCTDSDFDLKSDLVFFKPGENVAWIYESKNDFGSKVVRP